MRDALLRALARPAPDSLAAWEAVRAGTSLAALPPDAQWLLPLLYARLRAAGLAEAALAPYANVYRHNWYKQQVRLRALRPVWEGLQAHGLSPVLMGGAAVAATGPVRPFTTAVIAAPGLTPAMAEAAERALTPGTGLQLGWLTDLTVSSTEAVTAAGQEWRVPAPAERLAHALGGVAQAEDASAWLWAADALVTAEQLDPAAWLTVWAHLRAWGRTAVAEARLADLRAAGVALGQEQPA